MRVTVGMIAEALAAGPTLPDLLADFPYLEEQDFREALACAARPAPGHEIRLAVDEYPQRYEFDAPLG